MRAAVPGLPLTFPNAIGILGTLLQPCRQAREDVSTSLRRRCAALNVLITLTGGYFQQAPREEWRGVEDWEAVIC